MELHQIRRIAEYAYCPRLFYLEDVEGLFSESSDTEQGHSIHRRADSPVPRPPTKPAP